MRMRLIRAFFGCGDNDIIEFAMIRARLNRIEKEVLHLMMDECMTQEEIAEDLDYSTRKIQDIWYKAADKLLSIAWVQAYANELIKENKDVN